MSWVDYIDNNKLIITTGDGTVYQPLWKNAQKSKQYNTGIYQPINMDGSFVYRSKAPGSIIPLELYFVGDDCVDVSNAFDKSLNDERQLIIEHPYFGIKRVQPISININDSNQNVCKVTLTVHETIESGSPQQTEDETDNILSLGGSMYVTISATYVDKGIQDVSDINNMLRSIGFFYDDFKVLISDTAESSEFLVLTNSALRASENVITDATESVEVLISLIDYPFIVAQSIKSKLQNYKNTLNRLIEKVGNITGLNTSNYVAMYGSAILSAMAKTSVNTQPNDYKTRSDVFVSIDILRDTYSSFIAEIDRRTLEDSDLKGNYSPDSVMFDDLTELINKTEANLINISLASKIEREYYVTEDTNIIILNHRLNGTDSEDININEFIDINDIKGDQYIKIKRGQTVKYLRS